MSVLDTPESADVDGMRVYRTQHFLDVAAPAQQLYTLISDVTTWPSIYGQHLHHIQYLGPSITEEADRFKLWATINGEVGSWVSQRTLYPEELRLTMEQEQPRSPIQTMRGEWRFESLPNGGTRMFMLHRFTPRDDVPDAAAWILKALDLHCPEELASVARICLPGAPVSDVVFSFTETADLPGSAADAFDFVKRSELWAERLSSISSVFLADSTPGMQDLVVHAIAGDGSAHSSHSLRICQGPEWIAFKQIGLSNPLLGHSGEWRFTDRTPGRVVISVRHTVALNPATLPEVFGEDCSIADAKTHVRAALGSSSLAMMTQAANYADRRIRFRY